MPSTLLQRVFSTPKNVRPSDKSKPIGKKSPESRHLHSRVALHTALGGFLDIFGWGSFFQSNICIDRMEGAPLSVDLGLFSLGFALLLFLFHRITEFAQLFAQGEIFAVTVGGKSCFFQCQSAVCIQQ